MNTMIWPECLLQATTYMNVIQLCEESSNSQLGLDNVIDVTLIYALMIKR